MSNAAGFVGASSSDRNRTWPLQIVVGTIFTSLLFLIAGGLVLYNHVQLTRFAEREAQSKFDTITQSIGSERQAEHRTSELFFNMATSLINPGEPPDQLQSTLLRWS